METILCIETSTRPCSVALLHEKEVVFSKEEKQGPSHASLLGTFVKEALDFAKENEWNIEAVAVSCGPGSYTGLRIGVSLAKGLCFGMQIPLIPIHTLPLLASIASQKVASENTLICPMIDARRMEVYAAIYTPQLKEIKPVSADIIDESSYSDYCSDTTFYICGDGAEKCSTVLANAHYIPDIYPLAADMLPLVYQAIEKGDFLTDPAYFEPFYLKEFVATQSKKNILGI